MAQKLYCYVDESGQDTEGRFFVVSVLVVDDEKEDLERVLESIEMETGKGRGKWNKTTNVRRTAYIRKVINLDALVGRLNFRIHRHTTDYLALTISTISAVLQRTTSPEYKVIVLIDALPSSQVERVGSSLRRDGHAVKKVRGIKREENDALMRLVDAICGFLRDAYEDRIEMRLLFERALERGVLVNLAEGK